MTREEIHNLWCEWTSLGGDRSVKVMPLPTADGVEVQVCYRMPVVRVKAFGFDSLAAMTPGDWEQTVRQLQSELDHDVNRACRVLNHQENDKCQTQQ
jgi:hypothetical protein